VTGRTSIGQKITGYGDYSLAAQASPGATGKDNAEILDDQWLGTLLETGVLGVIGWLWLFGLAIRRLGRRAKLERDAPEGWLPVAMAAALAGFVASMWFYDAFTFTQGDFLTHVLIGFAAALLLLPVATRTGAGRVTVQS
jgi:O-antigen ligase